LLKYRQIYQYANFEISVSVITKISATDQISVKFFLKILVSTSKKLYWSVFTLDLLFARSGVVKGGNWEHVLQAQALGAHQHLFSAI